MICTCIAGHLDSCILTRSVFQIPDAKRGFWWSNAGLQTEPTYPIVLCIVAKNPWLQLYFRALEVLEQLLLADGLLDSCTVTNLPSSSNSATFLTSLHYGIATNPPPDTLIRLALPRGEYDLSRTYRLQTHMRADTSRDDVLKWGSDFVEVQVWKITPVVVVIAKNTIG